jgi:hypothetical protein
VATFEAMTIACQKRYKKKRRFYDLEDVPLLKNFLPITAWVASLLCFHIFGFARIDYQGKCAGARAEK